MRLIPTITLTRPPVRTAPPGPRARHDCRFPDPDADQTAFRAMLDMVLRHLAEPADLGRIFDRFPHCRRDDNVFTGKRWPLSQHALYGLARSIGFETYLEVGSRYGYSIGAVLTASRRLRHAVTVDPFVNPRHTLDNLSTLGHPAVHLEAIAQPSRDFHTVCLFDAVYVDGDHTYEAALGDLKQYWQYVAPGGLMMVDDTIGHIGKDAIGVLWAVEDFLQTTDNVAAAVLTLPTYSGFAIIQKKD
jgi:predicted O-methyltransferase YrrM